MTDVRLNTNLRLGSLPHDVYARLTGKACACCGRAAGPLRPGGWAYAHHPGQGCDLGWHVRVCPDCPTDPASGGAPVQPPDWLRALSWAVAAGAKEHAVTAAWRRGRAAAVPTGTLWDVVRVTRTLADDAVRRLRARGLVLGPVLLVPRRACVEFVVPPGTAASWPALYGTTCVGLGGTIRCPSPAGTPAACGRRWLSPPAGPVPTTDATHLAEVAAAALVHRTAALSADQEQTTPESRPSP
ncbi:hypothetical protein [Streptomyces albus]|uniref:hypothetical protein n=1 Tax=Streptomyces albus TaxID=1888 RepID=UPI0024E090AC|nr:hypothetical protein [Streptomyces albus]GHJ24430.1 hypothetical protein TPA0909_60440 [Streptomyces albus]